MIATVELFSLVDAKLIEIEDTIKVAGAITDLLGQDGIDAGCLREILMVLPAAIRQILEVRMQRYEYQGDFARKYYGQGREEGRQEGLRAAVITLARTKLKELSDGDITAIEALSDSCVLTELVTSLGQAHSVTEARVALDRALSQ